MTSLPPSGSLREQVVIARMPINAPNAELAIRVASLSDTLRDARDSGLETQLPLDEAPALASRAGPSWIQRVSALSRDGRSHDAPVAGYWVVVSRIEIQSDDSESPQRSYQTLNVDLELLPHPHREPFAFGSLAERPDASLREETRSYWEAMDLRALIKNKPMPSAAGPRL